MIKLFRNIRKNMINENLPTGQAGKTGRYLRYAIGEIVLVVIGILIALQLNTWNEHRKQLNTQNAIYRIIKEDLLNDISKIDVFTTEYDSVQKPGFDALLTQKLTTKDFEQNPSYLRLMTGFEDLSISQRGFNLLNSQSNITNIVEQNLPSEINKFYDEHIVEIDIAISELSGEFRDNLKNFKNYDWFSTLLITGFNNEEYIDYLSNDSNAKNRVALYYVFYSIYVSELKSFKTGAEILIADIDIYLNEN